MNWRRHLIKILQPEKINVMEFNKTFKVKFETHTLTHGIIEIQKTFFCQKETKTHYIGHWLGDSELYNTVKIKK